MKLKRCPNLHYYDGDKYAECPHCAEVKKAIPAPEPVTENFVQAESTVNSSDAQSEDIMPEINNIRKSSSGFEEHMPESDFVAAAEKAWRCEKCGAVNTADFCSGCGSPQPGEEPGVSVKAPLHEEWICECGFKNNGRFCYNCGRKCPEISSQDKPEAESAAGQQMTETEEKAKPDEYDGIFSSSEAVCEAHEKEHSIAEQVKEVSFTENIEDAVAKVSDDQDEDKTQIIFDDIDDGYVLAWLTVTNTSSKGKVYTVTDAKCTIGRADAEHPVDIDIYNDRGISRGVQAVVAYDPLNKKFFLQSSGGKTFIYVNKEMVLTYKELAAYDIIRVGGTDMVFVPLCSERFSW